MRLTGSVLIYLASTTMAFANNIDIEFVGGRVVSESSKQLIVTTNLIRNENNTSPVTLNYATEFSVSSAENASAGIDYEVVGGQLQWFEGESGSRTIVITIVDDIIKESTENFDLVFTTPINATINNNSSNVRFEIGIADNDVVKTTAVDGTPQNAIVETLNFYCASAESDDEQSLAELCRAFDSETSSENLEQALRAISPASSASQMRVGRQIQQQQLNNIGNRLSTLRSGIKKTNAIGEFSLSLDGQSIPLSSLLPSYVNQLDDDFSGLLGKRYDIFFTGNYSYGERKETANETGFKPLQYGISTGVDYRISNRLVAGVAIGLSKSRAKLYANVGEINTSGYDLIAYASYFYKNNYYFELVANHGAYQYDLERHIDFLLSGKTISETANAETESSQKAVSASGGYDHNFDWGSTLGLSFRLSHAASKLDAYEESGAGIYNLSLTRQKATSTTSHVELSLSHPFSYSSAVMVPQMRLAAVHEFSASAESVSGFLVADNSQSPFKFKSSESDQDYITLQFSLSAVLKGGISLFASYDTLLMYDDYVNHQFSLGARMESPF